jgi:hypothetical protein
MTTGNPGTQGFPRVIDPSDILNVLSTEDQKTSEILQKLKDSEKGKRKKKYQNVTQDGVLKVLRKMWKAGEIEGDKERFGFWMWSKKEEDKYR